MFAALTLLASIVTLFLTVIHAEYRSMPNGAVLLEEMIVTSENEQAIPAPLLNATYRAALPERGTIEYSQSIDEELDQLNKPALLMYGLRRGAQITLCGKIISPAQTFDGPSSHEWFEPFVYHISNNRCDSNTLSIRVNLENDGVRLRRIYVGEAGEINRAYRWRLFYTTEALFTSLGVAVLMALLAFAAIPLTTDRRLFSSFGLVMSFWALLIYFYLGPWTALSDRQEDVFFFAATLGLMFTALFFVNEWTFCLTWIGKYVRPLFAIMFLLIVNLMTIAPIAVQSVLEGLTYVICIFCIIGIIGMQCVFLLKDSATNYFESFLFLTATNSALLDMTSAIFPRISHAWFAPYGLSIPFLPLMSWLAACGMVLHVARRNSGIRRALESNNENLKQQLAIQQEELKSAYATREEKERETAILRERQRIMEDVHDGFGGKLLAMLLQAENKNLDQRDMADGLRSSLQELRLIVDSMDTADGALDQALGALRGRLEPQLNAAGVELKWRVEATTANLKFEPRAILSIYRVVQEATSNVIHHAQAGALSIQFTIAIPGRLCIELNDDGIGISQDAPEGRGLRNIKKRVGELGGSFELQKRSAGTSIRILIPEQISTP